MLADGHHNHEEEERGSQWNRRQVQEGSDKACYCFTAVKFQEDRIRVPDHDGKCGNAHPQRGIARELGGEPNREEAFRNIQQQGDYGD